VDLRLWAFSVGKTAGQLSPDLPCLPCDCGFVSTNPPENLGWKYKLYPIFVYLCFCFSKLFSYLVTFFMTPDALPLSVFWV
jgi:hypothetical protein